MERCGGGSPPRRQPGSGLHNFSVLAVAANGVGAAAGEGCCRRLPQRPPLRGEKGWLGLEELLCGGHRLKHRSSPETVLSFGGFACLFLSQREFSQFFSPPLYVAFVLWLNDNLEMNQ